MTAWIDLKEKFPMFNEPCHVTDTKQIGKAWRRHGYWEFQENNTSFKPTHWVPIETDGPIFIPSYLRLGNEYYVPEKSKPIKPAPIKFEWEQIYWVDNEYSHYGIFRAKVFGGWLIRGLLGEGDTMTFVPDKNHDWEIEK